VKLEQGNEMLKLFKSHVNKTSILDDFLFYDTREKIMRDRKSKQPQLLKKVNLGFMCITKTIPSKGTGSSLFPKLQHLRG
jgi:ribosomal protein S21